MELIAGILLVLLGIAGVRHSLGLNEEKDAVIACVTFWLSCIVVLCGLLFLVSFTYCKWV